VLVRLLLLAAAAGDERWQAIDIAVITAAVVTLAAALLRSAAILLLAAAGGVELGIARQVGLGIPGAELRRLVAARMRRLRRALLVALVERFVLRVVAAVRVVAGALGAIEIRLVLPELLLHRRDQAEIVFGVLIVIFRRHGVARRLRVAGKLYVLL